MFGNAKKQMNGIPQPRNELEVRMEMESEHKKRIDEFREEYNSNPKKSLEKLLLDYVISSYRFSTQIAVLSSNVEYKPIHSDYIKAIELLIKLNQ